MAARSLPAPATVLATALALVGAAWLGRAQGAPPPTPAKLEYRVVPWTIDDTTAVLRELTNDRLASVDDMAHSVARGTEPVDDPRVQAAVQRRLEARLAELGADGWDVFWVGDARAVVSGVLFPAPRLLAKRPAR
jgi:hypothetical protein